MFHISSYFVNINATCNKCIMCLSSVMAPFLSNEMSACPCSLQMAWGRTNFVAKLPTDPHQCICVIGCDNHKYYLLSLLHPISTPYQASGSQPFLGGCLFTVAAIFGRMVIHCQMLEAPKFFTYRNWEMSQVPIHLREHLNLS